MAIAPTTTHVIVSHTQHVAAGHDWLALGVEIATPVASLIVSGVALWFSNRQAERSHKTAEWQTRIASEQLKAQLFQRQFDAWEAVNMFAVANMKLIMKLDDFSAAGRSEQVIVMNRFDDAFERLPFLFADHVMRAAEGLRGAIMKTYIARQREVLHSNNPFVHPLPPESEMIEAVTEFEQSKGMLQRTVREQMVPRANIEP